MMAPRMSESGVGEGRGINPTSSERFKKGVSRGVPAGLIGAIIIGGDRQNLTTVGHAVIALPHYDHGLESFFGMGLTLLLGAHC